MNNQQLLFNQRLSRYLLVRSEGFTLIELLIVIVIVGLLSAVAIPNFLNQIRRARTSEAQTALYDLGRASEEFRFDHGTYPFASTWRINPYDRSNPPTTYTCASSLECVEGGVPGDPTYLRLYTSDPFREKAPNYSTLPGTPNTQVKASLSADQFSGILWGAVANTNLAQAYKNPFGAALDCRLGLGTAGTVGIQAGGSNIDGGCNLKIVNPIPPVDTVIVPDR